MRLRASQHAPEQQLRYDEAMSLVHQSRKSGQYRLGQFYLEQMAAQIRNIPEPTLFLMNVYLENMHILQAEPLVIVLLEKFPRDDDVLRHCARFYQLTDELDRAVQLVERATVLNPGNAYNHEMLGLIHRSLGDADKALQAFDEALKVQPRMPSAVLEKVRIQRQRSSQKFIDHIESILTAKGLRDEDRASLHFALALIHEHADSSQQFHHLNIANQLMAGCRPYDVESNARFAENTVGRFSRSAVAALAGQSSEEAAPVFIASLARSGTTLLEQMLSAHSELAALGESAPFHVALEREANKGNPLLSPNGIENTSHPTEHIADIASGYKKNYFVERTGDLRGLDKSIQNYAEVGFIVTVFPKARIIDLQRNPMDVIYSCYRQDFTVGNNYAFNLEHLAYNYLNYQRLMNHWRTAYPDNIVSVHYEDIVNDPEPQLRKILAFCGLPWEDACLSYREHIGLVKTASDAQVRAPLHQRSVEGWRRVESYLQTARDILLEAGVPL